MTAREIIIQAQDRMSGEDSGGLPNLAIYNSALLGALFNVLTEEQAKFAVEIADNFWTEFMA